MRRHLRVLACAVVCAVPTLSHTQGDARRGEAIVRDRSVGLCLLCHSAPGTPPGRSEGGPTPSGGSERGDTFRPDERFQGNLAPPLAGAGLRHTRDELRARIEDSRRFNPQTIMPAYARTSGFARVGSAFDGKPILDAAQIEDVVAFLATLR